MDIAFGSSGAFLSNDMAALGSVASQVGLQILLRPYSHEIGHIIW